MDGEKLSFSRLSTWLQCGWKGYQTYVLGFEPGTTASYNLLGTTVHSCIEHLHDIEDFWKLPVDDVVKLAHKQLDDIWRVTLRGKEELIYFKQYDLELEKAYEDTRREYEKRTGKKSKAPWMTSYFLEQHKPSLNRYKVQFSRITKNLCIDAFEPIEAVFKDSYSFVEKYVRLVRQELYRPKEIISEVDFEDVALSKMSFLVEDQLYPFRGKIDQIWLMKDGDIFLFDIKSGRKNWNSAAVRNSDQLFLYAKYVLMTYGRLPDKVGIIDVRNSKLTQWFVEQTDFDTFVNRITEKLRLYETIRSKGLYFPAAGSTDNFCSHCPIGRSNNCVYYNHTKDEY